jgi:hypothetical protein
MSTQTEGDLPQGTYVRFNIRPVSGVGKVVGMSNTGVPGLGKGYILEIKEIKSENGVIDYPYTHMVAFDRQMVMMMPQPIIQSRSEALEEEIAQLRKLLSDNGLRLSMRGEPG